MSVNANDCELKQRSVSFCYFACIAEIVMNFVTYQILSLYQS